MGQLVDGGVRDPLRIDRQPQASHRIEPVTITAMLADQDLRPDPAETIPSRKSILCDDLCSFFSMVRQHVESAVIAERAQVTSRAERIPDKAGRKGPCLTGHGGETDP